MLDYTSEGMKLLARAQLLPLTMGTIAVHVGGTSKLNEHFLGLIDAWAEKHPPLDVEPLPAVRLTPVSQASKAPLPISPLRGASLPPSRSPQPAKWQMWSKMPTCALWEAVCLTYDIEPDGERHDMSHWLEMKRGVPYGFPTDFADRLRVAQANVSTQGPIEPVELRVGVLENPRAKVRLSEVAKFAIGCEWEIPAAMRALARPATSDAKGEQDGKKLKGLDAMRVPGDGGMSIGRQWLADDAPPEPQATRIVTSASAAEEAEAHALLDRIEGLEEQVRYWESRDDTKASDAKIKLEMLGPLRADLALLKQEKRVMRGDSDVSPPQPQAAPVVDLRETKEQRQDRRLQACIDAGLPMDTKDALLRLPDGVGEVADREGVSRQAFSTDVKAALNRRETAKREGATAYRA